MKETRVPLLVGDRIEYVSIRQIAPSSLDVAYVYNCGSIGLQIVSPLEVEKPRSFLYKSGAASGEKYPFAFTGRGYVLGGIIRSKKVTPQQAAAMAARGRMLKNKKLIQ